MVIGSPFEVLILVLISKGGVSQVTLNTKDFFSSFWKYFPGLANQPWQNHSCHFLSEEQFAIRRLTMSGLTTFHCMVASHSFEYKRISRHQCNTTNGMSQSVTFYNHYPTIPPATSREIFFFFFILKMIKMKCRKIK